MKAGSLGHAIDFGTSTSAIVVCQPDGVTIPVPNPASPYGLWSIPTSIYVRAGGSVLVGSAADHARDERPAAYRREFKREFGSQDSLVVGKEALTAADMTVHVLRFLRQQAMARVPGEAERVVITVPASWEAGRHAAMRDAAAQAGYRDAEVSLVPEPVAALADVFGNPRDDRELTTLVYDLGGGTFDCAVARGRGGQFEVLGAPGGIGYLGGADFDGLLLNLLAQRVGGEVGALLDGATTDKGILVRRLSLRDECERIKWELSREPLYDDLLTSLKPPPWVRMERAEFEALIRPLLAETIAECQRMLGQLDLSWRDVNRVVPTGGSSNIPLVQAMLAQATGVVVLRPDDPARSVVNGAADLCHAALAGASLDAYAKWEAPALPPVAEPGSWFPVGAPDFGDDADLADPADRASVSAFIALLTRYKDKLPSQRKPNVIVCGETGTGKTTTINTLFGEEVGEVGYYSRGTSQDELYEWESQGHSIDVVDLPGLGDTKQRDKEYREMYRRRVAKADGFIVVVTPPRPANEATIKTVNLLVSCGVDPERIVFAYNRTTAINARVGGTMREVKLDGLAGPATPDDAWLIEQACKAFNKDLAATVRNGRLAGKFPLDKVVPFDALSGWNLFAVLDAVLESLPGDSLMKWRDAVTRAAKDLQRRTEERLAQEAAEHAQRVAELEREIAQFTGDQAATREPGGDQKKASAGIARATTIRSTGTSGSTGGRELERVEAEVQRRAAADQRKAEADRLAAEQRKQAVARAKATEAELRQKEAKRQREVAVQQAQVAQKKRELAAQAAEAERQRKAVAERRAAELEQEKRELADREASRARQEEAARQIAARRDTHVDKAGEKFFAWAAEKAGVAVSVVKSAGNALKRWWRGR